MLDLEVLSGDRNASEQDYAMPEIAITRKVSPRMNDCELSFQARQPINLAKAMTQHQAYCRCLSELGLEVVSLPAQPELPDSVFVEDPAIVLEEIAVILHPGAPSRRRESETLAAALAQYRTLAFLPATGTMEGGDVLRLGRSLFIGQSSRSNREGLRHLREIVQPYGYHVHPVAVKNCLHLKSAACLVAPDLLLVNRSWVDLDPFEHLSFLDVPPSEPNAANVLAVDGTVIMPASFPETEALLEKQGFRVRTIDLSELQKAEGGVTCCSLILQT
jgi:dimethylargininase